MESLQVAHRFPTIHLSLELSYEQVGAVQRLVHPPDVEIVDEDYGERVHLVLRVRESRKGEIEVALANLGLGTPSSV